MMAPNVTTYLPPPELAEANENAVTDKPPMSQRLPTKRSWFWGSVAAHGAGSNPLLALAIGDITKLGLRQKPYGAMEQIKRDGRIPLIDVGTLALVRAGHLKVAPGIERFTENGVVFEGGAAQAFDAVLLATGYRPLLEEILPIARELFDAHGALRADAKRPPGVHLCGFQLSTRGMLKEIGIEARAVAQQIAAAAPQST